LSGVRPGTSACQNGVLKCNGGTPPGAEKCNGLDDDCDGFIDDADPGIVGQTTWYADADGDGYGNPAVSQVSCNQPAGYVGRVGCAASIEPESCVMPV
jgi:hypothetical protein